MERRILELESELATAKAAAAAARLRLFDGLSHIRELEQDRNEWAKRARAAERKLAELTGEDPK